MIVKDNVYYLALPIHSHNYEPLASFFSVHLKTSSWPNIVAYQLPWNNLHQILEKCQWDPEVTLKFIPFWKF